jgi:phosphoribosylcarboxyaminoimidazole (NCAIR) mutase
MKRPLVAIIMGSDSDWPVMKIAAQMLADFGRQPKAVEAEGDDLKKRAFAQKVAKFVVVARENNIARLRRALRRVYCHVVHEKSPLERGEYCTAT